MLCEEVAVLLFSVLGGDPTSKFLGRAVGGGAGAKRVKLAV